MSNVGQSSSLILAVGQAEALLAGGRATEAMILLASLLPSLNEVRTDSALVVGLQGSWECHIGEICQRFSTCWAKALSAKVDVGKIDTGNLIKHLDVLQNLLMGTYSGSLDQYIAALLRTQNMQVNSADLPRMMLAWTPNSAIGWSPLDHQSMFPMLVTAVAVAALATPAPVTKEAAAARSKAMQILAKSHGKESLLAKYQPLRLLSKAWRNCDEGEDAEAAREFLVQAIELSAALPARDTPVDHDEKEGLPVLLVAVESGFEQFDLATWAARLRPLQNDCRMVAVKLTRDIPEGALVDFDVVEDLTKTAGSSPAALYRAFLSLLDKWRPVALLLPDSDAPVWRILLGRRRHVAWQVAGMEGPIGAGQERRMALSEVDEWLDAERPALRQESIGRVFVHEGLAAGFAELPEAEVLPCRDAWQEGERLRIAIVARPPQLKADFIGALGRLYQDKGAQLRFTFLMEGARAIELQAAEHNLYRTLRAVECHALPNKGELVKQLAHCHLRFNPLLAGNEG